MVVLEGHVSPERWDVLREGFAQAAANPPPQMLHFYLVQSREEPTLWRSISVWRSRSALAEYRRETRIPMGMVLFRAAGAEFTVELFEVAAHLPPGDG